MIDFKAAIFDLDGTLIDSMWVWEKVDKEFLAKRNLSVPKNYGENIAGLSFEQTAQYTIDNLGLTDSVQELVAEWNEMGAYEYANNVKLRAHAKDYLLKLKSLGVRLSTATSLSPVLSELVLKSNGVYDLFHEQCHADEVGKGKTEPDIFLLAAKKLGVDPEHCIVFEDILPGVISAKKAGMKVFCVHDEYSKHNISKIQDIVEDYLYDFRDAPLPNKS